MKRISPFFLTITLAFSFASELSADSQPVINLVSPTTGAVLEGPVHFVATATTSCAKGISALSLFAAGRLAYVTYTANLDTQLALDPGIYNATIRVSDGCGGSALASMSIVVDSRGTDIFSQKPVSAATQSNAEATSTTATTTSTACGPPTYCSRTDTNVVQYPSPLPNLGGLHGINTVINEPDFHNPVLRITDAGLQPNFPNRSYHAGLGGSGDKVVWNLNSTIVSVGDSGGRYIPIKFDPVNVKQLGLLYSKDPIFSSGPGVFSRNNPNYFYAFIKGRVLLLDYTNRATPPTPKLIYDFKNCGIAVTSMWQGIAGVDTTDTVFGAAYSSSGTQGTGVHIVAYNSSTKSCTHLNTSTGAVTSWPSPKQLGTVQIPDRFTVHNVVLKGGLWMVITRQKLLSQNGSNGTLYAWQMGSTVLKSLMPQGSGHWAAGCSVWFNSPGMLNAYYLARRYSTPDLFEPIWTVPKSSCGAPNTPSCTMPFDAHPTTYGGCSDNTPVCTSTRIPNSTVSPPKMAWPYQDEIVCFSSDGSNKAWRFAHTLSYPSNDFYTNSSIGALSQDGKFYAWTTNNGGAFGCKDGTMNCTIRNRRSDVVVVKLK
jgi:hypothetical protein